MIEELSTNFQVVSPSVIVEALQYIRICSGSLFYLIYVKAYEKSLLDSGFVLLSQTWIATLTE